MRGRHTLAVWRPAHQLMHSRRILATRTAPSTEPPLAAARRRRAAVEVTDAVDDAGAQRPPGKPRLYSWLSERASCEATALALDEDQAPAGARSTPRPLLHS